MWQHPATRRNVRSCLPADGITFVGPNVGEMAEANEAGPGRMAEPDEILAAIEAQLGGGTGLLHGRHVLVTAGPTHEAIDPVRYIANRSSGAQGYAIADAAARLGARVTLVSGPTNLAAPAGVETIRIESAREMLAAVQASLPADIAIFAAAVADWRAAQEADQKIKKTGKGVPTLSFTENPDILRTVARSSKTRPELVIGFAAETESVISHAKAKLKKKGCDWARRQRCLAGGWRHGRSAQHGPYHLEGRCRQLAGNGQGRTLPSDLCSWPRNISPDRLSRCRLSACQAGKAES